MRTCSLVTSAALLMLTGSAAFGHGPVAEQASKAVARVTASFLETESALDRENFESVSALLIGDERFLVEIILKNKAKKFAYTCGLDDAVKPVKWGCKKN